MKKWRMIVGLSGGFLCAVVLLTAQQGWAQPATDTPTETATETPTDTPSVTQTLTTT